MNKTPPLTRPVTSLLESNNLLGEGPLWSEQHRALYWVDIIQCQLHCLQTGNSTQAHQVWSFDKKISAVTETQSSKLLLAMEDGVAVFNKDSSYLHYLCKLDTDKPHNRTNDAKCDPQGRFWVGTMDNEEQECSGCLWCVSPSGNKQKMLDNIGISNTLAWDEKRQRFYFADSMKGTIYRFDFNAETGQINHQSVFVKTEQGIAPDGSCIDAEGYLWNAQWDGWKIVRYNPEGHVDRIIPLPVQRPTSCTFGGDNYKTLFITSARVGLTEKELAKQPQAGHVLMIDLQKDLQMDIQGLPATPFAKAY